jgi:hypothetical protein
MERCIKKDDKNGLLLELDDKIEQITFDLRNQKEELEYDLRLQNEKLEEKIKELEAHIKKSPPKVSNKIKNNTNIKQQT